MNVTGLAELFLSQGALQQTGGNQPFWVDEPGHVWFVESGCVDLFVVPAAEAGVGIRTHFLRATSGQIIVGFTRDEAVSKLRFQGVAHSSARLLQIPLHRVQELSALEAGAIIVAEALDVWIQTIYQELSASTLPSDCLELTPDQEIELKVGEATQPVDGVLWVKHLKGHSSLAGFEQIVVGAHNCLVPLTPKVWLKALEPVTLRGAGTAAQLRSGLIWPALPAFNARIRQWVELKLLRDAERETARLEAKTKARHTALQGAVVHLAHPLLTGSQPAAALLRPSEPLFGAFQLVCQALGVSANLQHTATTGREPKDALDRLVRGMRLDSRRVMLNGEWWRQDNGPMLGYTQVGNRPVALVPASAASYELVDPADGTRKPVTSELAQSLNPAASMFYRPFPERVPTIWEVFKFGLFGTKRDQRLVLSLSLAGGLLGVAMPLATGLVFDSVIPSDSRPQLWFVALALLVASFTSVVFVVTRDIALLRVGAKSDIAIQSAVWDRLLSLPLPFFRSFTAGDLAMRANGINAIQQILNGAVITSMLGGVFSVFNFCLLFYFSARLAFLATALVLLNMGATVLASWAGLRLQRPLYEIQGKLSGQVLQFITGIAKLRVAGAELQAFAVWAKGFGEQKKLTLRAGVLANAMAIFNESYPVLTTMCLFAVVAFWTEPGLTTGRFLAFNVAFMSFLSAGLNASDALISILQAVPIYERAQPILRALPEVRELQADPGFLRGGFELSRVSFRYKPDGPRILSDLSFQISPGEFVAVVGPSGSGKSTMMRLLLGFEIPESGAIRFDGLDLAGLDAQAVRRQIGVVLQNGKLMPGDVLENIVGSGLFTLDDAWDAARKAGLEEDINEMPMGMHTVLGETGATLSGGQRQRLMIARAIVAKPRILLFDEATSALDNRTQAIVSQSLQQLLATRVVIAHRLSTILHADRILVLQQGRLVQTGSYEQLMRVPGPFADLARRQLA